MTTAVIKGEGALHFLHLSSRFWTGPTRRLAWLLTAAIAAFVLLGVFLQARINQWNAQFFDALEKKASDQLGGLLGVFALYVLLAGLIMAATVLARMAMQVKLRESIGRQLVTLWLGKRTYYRLHLKTKGAETPEFRIADDVRLAVDPMVDLSIGFLSSLLLAITFFWVLAQVGGSITVPGTGIVIPAYFLIGAILYACVMSGIASLLGWPLIRSIQGKNHREGVFRYELTRVRQAAPQIAHDQAEGREEGVISGAIDQLVASWRNVMKAQSRVAGVASSNAVLVGVFPVLLAVPKYVSGEMTLGAVMQLATAFVQVQMALNWMVDNFVRFAEWRASANRVGEFVHSMEELAETADSEPPSPAEASAGSEAVRPLAAVVPAGGRG